MYIYIYDKKKNMNPRTLLFLLSKSGHFQIFEQARRWYSGVPSPSRRNRNFDNITSYFTLQQYYGLDALAT